MRYIITEEQLDRLIPPEDIDFVKQYKKEMNRYPNWRGLQQMDLRVGDIMPNHSKKDLKVRTFMDNYLKKNLSSIVSKLSFESDEAIERGPLGSRNYVTIDGKKALRSELEALTYNIFALENLTNEIEIDSKRFKKDCGGKEPDFVWEKKKIIIEVAGMEDEEYKNKLEIAEDCFKRLKYTVYVINARPFEKQGKYVEYYSYVCKLLGFKPNQDVIESPYKYLGYKEVDREFRQNYIDDNINKLPLDRTQSYTLNKYINQLYGYGIKEYKIKNNLSRFRHSVDKNEIRKYKAKNPTMSNTEIANHFGVHKNTIQIATVGMEGRKK